MSRVTLKGDRFPDATDIKVARRNMFEYEPDTYDILNLAPDQLDAYDRGIRPIQVRTPITDLMKKIQNYAYDKYEEIPSNISTIIGLMRRLALKEPKHLKQYFDQEADIFLERLVNAYSLIKDDEVMVGFYKELFDYLAFHMYRNADIFQEGYDRLSVIFGATKDTVNTYDSYECESRELYEERRDKEARLKAEARKAEIARLEAEYDPDNPSEAIIAIRKAVEEDKWSFTEGFYTREKKVEYIAPEIKECTDKMLKAVHEMRVQSGIDKYYPQYTEEKVIEQKDSPTNYSGIFSSDEPESYALPDDYVEDTSVPLVVIPDERVSYAVKESEESEDESINEIPETESGESSDIDNSITLDASSLSDKTVILNADSFIEDNNSIASKENQKNALTLSPNPVKVKSCLPEGYHEDQDCYQTSLYVPDANKNLDFIRGSPNIPNRVRTLDRRPRVSVILLSIKKNASTLSPNPVKVSFCCLVLTHQNSSKNENNSNIGDYSRILRMLLFDLSKGIFIMCIFKITSLD